MPDNQSLEGPIDVASPVAGELARRFGAKSGLARRGVKAFFESLVSADSPRVRSAFARWKELFGTAGGHDLDRPDRRLDRLADLYGVVGQRVRPAEILFAVHTYFALVVKLLVWATVAGRAGQGGRSQSSRQRKWDFPLCRTAGDDLHRAMDALESGGVAAVRSVVGPAEQNPFGWYAAAWSAPVEQLVRDLAASLAQTHLLAPAGGGDLLRGLYEALLPGEVRHRLGEFYTPDWLARHVLDAAGFSGQPGARLLDPACGSGTFLVGAIDLIRRAADPARLSSSRGETCREILRSVVGFDLNPLAVLAARANYLLALGDLVDDPAQVEIPIHLRDAILPDDGGRAGQDERFDFVVGNPPWIAWDNLPKPYRQATRPLWRQYGLFSLSGSDARHGGGKKDLSMLLTYVAADRYLKRGGRLAFVLTQTLLQTKGAGDGFRRFRLGETGEPLAVLRADDMVRLRPFAGAANWTAALVLEKGRPTTYPVPYTLWSPAEGADGGPAGRQRLHRRACLAEPIDAGRPTSPWFVRPEDFETPLASLIGPSDYRAHLGANTGGANGVYWVELLESARDRVRVRNLAQNNRSSAMSVTEWIEPDLLYPLLRWGDVDRYRSAPSVHLLLVQDVDLRRGIEPETMERDYPAAMRYFQQFEGLLRKRAAYKRYQHRAAFYSMYNVGPYTVAPWKVVWRRMDRRVRAAVVGPVDDPLLGRRPVVPQETCVLVAAGSADEAHYLCAVLNSVLVDFLVRAHSVRGGKGFGTPSMLDYVRLRRFDADDPRHMALARLSRQAHAAAAAGKDLTACQREADRLAGSLWELRPEQIEAIRRQSEEGM